MTTLEELKNKLEEIKAVMVDPNGHTPAGESFALTLDLIALCEAYRKIAQLEWQDNRTIHNEITDDIRIPIWVDVERNVDLGADALYSEKRGKLK